MRGDVCLRRSEGVPPKVQEDCGRPLAWPPVEMQRTFPNGRDGSFNTESVEIRARQRVGQLVADDACRMSSRHRESLRTGHAGPAGIRAPGGVRRHRLRFVNRDGE